MTISTLQNGLRRALTTLESSPSSSDGSPPSPTVGFETPEERLAARLVRRLHLIPRIDVFAIANSMAVVERGRLPANMDGVCLGLKAIGKRPRIFVSDRVSALRQRFTLAHEIGHIVIPWHTGSIIDDLSVPGHGEQTAYRKMEAEANRFASELLMPSDWVQTLIDRAEHLGGVMLTIAKVAEVSYPAALYKTLRMGPPGHLVAVARDGVIVQSDATPNSWRPPPEVGASIEALDMRQIALDPYVIMSETQSYYWWKLRDQAADDEFNPPLAALLNLMLTSVPLDQRAPTRANIDAIITFALGKAGYAAPADQLYNACVEATQGRSDRDAYVATLVGHPSFSNYVLARVAEHVTANEYADMISATYHDEVE